MDNKNILLNHTLEEYKKKYRNREHRLLKITKKEVEEFDKKYSTYTKGYLLKDRKWWLIGDAYYEIPKAPRYTWFRNINAACQIGTCVLVAGVVAAAVTIPLVLMNQTIEPDVSIDSVDKIEWSNKHYDKDGNACLTIKGKDGNEITSLTITIENYICIEKEDYTYTISSGELIVKKSCVDAHPGKINIKPNFKEPVKETAKEKFIRLAHEYIYGTNGFANSTTEYLKSDIEDVYLFGEKVTDFTAEYTTDAYGRVFEISGNDWYYDFGSCQYYTDENLNSILRDEKVGHTTYTFTDDYISYTTDECKAEDGEEKSLTINKYGYVTKEIYYYTEYGGWCDSHITLKNKPEDHPTEIILLNNPSRKTYFELEVNLIKDKKYIAKVNDITETGHTLYGNARFMVQGDGEGSLMKTKSHAKDVFISTNETNSFTKDQDVTTKEAASEWFKTAGTHRYVLYDDLEDGISRYNISKNSFSSTEKTVYITFTAVATEKVNVMFMCADGA